MKWPLTRFGISQGRVLRFQPGFRNNYSWNKIGARDYLEKDSVPGLNLTGTSSSPSSGIHSLAQWLCRLTYVILFLARGLSWIWNWMSCSSAASKPAESEGGFVRRIKNFAKTTVRGSCLHGRPWLIGSVFWNGHGNRRNATDTFKKLKTKLQVKNRAKKTKKL